MIKYSMKVWNPNTKRMVKLSDGLNTVGYVRYSSFKSTLNYNAQMNLQVFRTRKNLLKNMPAQIVSAGSETENITPI